MLPLLAILVIFGAIVCLVLGVSWRGESVLSARIAGLRGEAEPVITDFRSERLQQSMSARVLAPLASSLGVKLQSMLPTRWADGLSTKLIQAGQPTTVTGFLVAIALAEGTALSFGLTLMVSGGGISKSGLMFTSVLALFGLFLPKIWLGNRVRHRQKDILKSLPDAFDLITVCVEAGLGLEAALARVAEKSEGPFGEELAIALREVSLGKLRREALRELADRTGVPDLTSFINAVIQAESMGTSIAAVLRVQAELMRTKRRQRAEQQAHEAPIKMMFPLVLCIFPTLFIVILGPAGIEIYDQFITRT